MVDKDQFEKFKQAAREHDCDESEEAFEKTLGKVAKAKPDKPEEKQKKEEPGD